MLALISAALARQRTHVNCACVSPDTNTHPEKCACVCVKAPRKPMYFISSISCYFCDTVCCWSAADGYADAQANVSRAIGPNSTACARVRTVYARVARPLVHVWAFAEIYVCVCVCVCNKLVRMCMLKSHTENADIRCNEFYTGRTKKSARSGFIQEKFTHTRTRTSVRADRTEARMLCTVTYVCGGCTYVLHDCANEARTWWQRTCLTVGDGRPDTSDSTWRGFFRHRERARARACVRVYQHTGGAHVGICACEQ